MKRAQLIRLGVAVTALSVIACVAPNQPALPGDAQVDSGRALYGRGQFDSSRAILLPLTDLAGVSGDSLIAAKALTVLGAATRREGEHNESDSLHRLALSVKLALGAEEELVSSYNGLGLLAWDQYRLTDAMGLFQEAAEIARRYNDREAWSTLQNNIGLIHTDLGEFESARTSFIGALETGGALGDDRRQADALNNLGMLDIWVGDPGSALPSLYQALDLYRSVGYVPGEQNTLAQLGTAFTALGEPSRAIAVLDSAVAQSRTFGLAFDEALNLDALAEVYGTAGDVRRALSLYEDVREIESELGLPERAGRTSRRVAEIYQYLGNLELATRHADSALAVHRAAGARLEEFADLVVLAEVSAEAGRIQLSSTYLQAATDIARTLDVRSARVDVALAEARIASAANNMPRVLEVLDAAAEDLSAGGYDSEWEAEFLRARANEGLGRLDEAARSGRRAVAAVERVRSGFGSGALRTTYLAGRTDAYAGLVGVLHESGNRREAFEVADAIRGRALLEHMAAVRSDEVPGFSSTEMIAEGEAVLRSIEGWISLTNSLETVTPAERTSDLVDEIRRIRGRITDARVEYEAISVRMAELQGPRSTMLGAGKVRAEDVQEALNPDQALLEYLVTPDHLFLFVVRRDTIEIVKTPTTERDLTNRIRLARDLLTDRAIDIEILSPVLEGLYTILVSPAVASGHLRGVHHITVVPHGPLSYLPFAALKEKASDRYLVEDYVLSYLPTAGALLLGGAQAPEREVADRQPRVEAFAPLPDQLPATRLEVGSIEDVLRGSRSRIGRRATEQRVRRALASDRVVHLATHGILNSTSPMFSRIELYPSGGAGTSRDGRLEVHEVLGLTIRSPLVFLSGCETGLGVAWSTEFSRGEDYTTLAQAFLYAGARNVIATLWPIDDAGAAEFVQHFYTAYQRASPGEALVEAQRRMISDPRYGAPYYWAAYQLAGTGAQ